MRIQPDRSAAGFDKTCRHLDALGRVGFGFVVGGTITRHQRDGNPKPRIARSPARRAIVNAMGLPNPGADAVAAILARVPRTAAVRERRRRRLGAALETVELLAPHVDGFELNASSPNAPWRHDPEHMETLLASIATTPTDRCS